MLGLMQDRPLLISSLIEFAGLNHGDEEIVSRTVEGPVHRYTYSDCLSRSRRLDFFHRPGKRGCRLPGYCRGGRNCRVASQLAVIWENEHCKPLLQHWGKRGLRIINAFFALNLNLNPER